MQKIVHESVSQFWNKISGNKKQRQKKNIEKTKYLLVEGNLELISQRKWI